MVVLLQMVEAMELLTMTMMDMVMVVLRVNHQRLITHTKEEKK
jgi:hypothetical protein